MARPKRGKFEIKKTRNQIVELYIQGKYQSEIGEMLSLSQPQISYDLKLIQKEWAKKTTFNLDEYKKKELARIDLIEREAWIEWDRSKKEIESRTTKAMGVKKDKKGKLSSSAIDNTNKTQGRIGDSKFLEVVLKCIERRCKLLGIDAPAKVEGLENLKDITLNFIIPDKNKEQEIKKIEEEDLIEYK